MRQLTCLLVVVGACSGSDGSGGGQPAAPGPANGEPSEQGGDGAEAGTEDNAERKLRAAQAAAIEAMCERLVDCSIADARASMSAEEIAKLDLETLVPQAHEDCEDKYGQSQLSPRQIRVIQRCVGQASDCPALNACLDEARRKDEGSR